VQAVNSRTDTFSEMGHDRDEKRFPRDEMKNFHAAKVK
jgi:hypothetical protein